MDLVQSVDRRVGKLASGSYCRGFSLGFRLRFHNDIFQAQEGKKAMLNLLVNKLPMYVLPTVHSLQYPSMTWKDIKRRQHALIFKFSPFLILDPILLLFAAWRLQCG